MNQPDDIFAKLASDKYYTKIDMAKGYWQISVASEEQVKTAISAFDQGNSASTFTRITRKLLKGLDNVCSGTTRWTMGKKWVSHKCVCLIIMLLKSDNSKNRLPGVNYDLC